MTVVCPLCVQSCFSSLDALRHRLIKAANGPLACPICDEMLMGLDKLTIHLFSHTNQKRPEICLENRREDAGHRFESTNLDTLGNETEYVNKYLVNDPNYCNGLEKLGSSTTFEHKCQFCTKTFEAKSTLLKHEQREHKSDIASFSNTAIRKNDADNLHEFNYLAMQEGPPIVTECNPLEEINNNNPLNNMQTDDSDLLNSLKMPDMENNSKLWKCSTCSKCFTTKYFLKKHKRLHTGEMPYTCEICARTFTFQQSYHKHLMYHSDEKPHTCTTCGRAFKELSTLHNHERIHSGEKPYKCEVCGKHTCSHGFLYATLGQTETFYCA